MCGKERPEPRSEFRMTLEQVDDAKSIPEQPLRLFTYRSIRGRVGRNLFRDPLDLSYGIDGHNVRIAERYTSISVLSPRDRTSNGDKFGAGRQINWISGNRDASISKNHPFSIPIISWKLKRVTLVGFTNSIFEVVMVLL